MLTILILTLLAIAWSFTIYDHYVTYEKPYKGKKYVPYCHIFDDSKSQCLLLDEHKGPHVNENNMWGEW